MSDESKKKEPEVQEQEETPELSDDQLETASGGAQTKSEDQSILNKYFKVEIKGMYSDEVAEISPSDEPTREP